GGRSPPRWRWGLVSAVRSHREFHKPAAQARGSGPRAGAWGLWGARPPAPQPPAQTTDKSAPRLPLGLVRPRPAPGVRVVGSPPPCPAPAAAPPRSGRPLQLLAHALDRPQ